MINFYHRLLLLVIAVLFGVEVNAGDNKKNWRLHPSFDSSPVKIVDTPDITYFLVLQQKYDKSIKNYDTPSMTVFCRDKRMESGNIIPVTDVAVLSSLDICDIEYSIPLNSLIIGYRNGTVDIVEADGVVRNVNLTGNEGYPGMNNIRNIITPSYTDDIIICNDTGYSVIDGKTGIISGEVVFGKPVDALFMTGKRAVLLTEGKIYLCNEKYPDSFDGLDSISNISSVLWAAPLDERSFAYITGSPGTTVQLSVAEIQDDASLKISNLCSDNFTTVPVGQMTGSNRYEGNFIRNRDGYLLYSEAYAWQLYCAEGGAWNAKNIPLDKSMNPIGSWDFDTFITYRDRGTFVNRSARNNGGAIEWTDSEVPCRPLAPGSFITTEMAYSPRYGLFVVNHGNEALFPGLAYISPSLLSCWDGKNWKLYSHAYFSDPPREIKEDEKYISLWHRNKERYPVFDPTGLAIDPISPDIAVFTSTFGGLTFVNLSNPDQTPIRICSPTDPLVTLPGSIAGFPDQNWTSFCALSAPSFDADSTLWFAYINLIGSEEKKEPTFLLKYITKEKRRELYADYRSVSVKDLFGTVDVPYYEVPGAYGRMQAFKNRSSRNYLIADMQQWERGLFVINHKGTLYDSSDDEYKRIYGYIDSSGRKIDFTLDWNIIEDPLNGNVIVAYYEGLATFHPSGDVSADGYISGRDFTVSAGGERIIPSVCMVTDMIFDSFGRLWIATQNQGVVCLSVDRKRVEYRLTKSSTPLPSDRVYGLGWNPQTNSLMVSTDLGLAEFTPDISAVNYAGSEILLYPDKITPDYHGGISLCNLPANSTITVRDKNGNNVMQLFPSSDTSLTWDLNDNTGKRIPSGVYTIEIEGKPDAKRELIVSTPK